jgi:argininosuccinate synthase
MTIAVDASNGRESLYRDQSRGVYETPGGTILWFATAISRFCMTRGDALWDMLLPKFAV